MRIKTELLQNMVAKAIQGAGNNKMIPLTSLIGIEYLNNNLVLTTTDGSNQFKVNMTSAELGNTQEQSNFYTIVDADIFAKLVGKTTKEFIELENKENYLEVIGNGTYKLEIAINEEGEMVKFPKIENMNGKELAINLIDLQEAIRVAKASVAKTMEIPCLTGYYISDNTISTNKQLACKLANNLVTEPILISSEMAELLLLVEGAEILELIKQDNDLIFYTANYTIAGKELANKDLYPVQAIQNLTALNYDNMVKVNKQELLNILDRMSLFVNEYDKNGIFLKFTPDELIVRSQKSNAEENISFVEALEVKEFQCLVDIDMLRSEVESISTDIVELHYGQDKSIKIVDGKATFVISLLEKAS